MCHCVIFLMKEIPDFLRNSNLCPADQLEHLYSMDLSNIMREKCYSTNKSKLCDDLVFTFHMGGSLVLNIK